MLSLAKRIRETVTPARKTSAFLTQGVLTPEEFVEAGEQLVYKCPTWTWCVKSFRLVQTPPLLRQLGNSLSCIDRGVWSGRCGRSAPEADSCAALDTALLFKRERQRSMSNEDAVFPSTLSTASMVIIALSFLRRVSY